MDPGVFSGRIEGRRWEGVEIVGAVCERARCEGVRCFDSVGQIGG